MIFMAQTYSVLLVSPQESNFADRIQPLLPGTHYGPVQRASSVAEARRLLARTDFDLVLINAPLPDDFGMELAQDICSGSGAGVLLLVRSELFEEMYAKGVSCGVIPLAKPTSLQTLSQSLRILCATRERLRRLEARQATVEEKIQEIRLVNQAKWRLIECLGMTEAEAHRYIEKQAMDLRISKQEQARRILKTYP